MQLRFGRVGIQAIRVGGLGLGPYTNVPTTLPDIQQAYDLDKYPSEV